MLSPLFDKISKNASALRVKSPPLSIVVKNLSESQQVDSVIDAEDALFALATVGGSISRNLPEPGLSSNIAIMRAANTIASKTLRGAGNRVFFHPSNLDLIGSGSSLYEELEQKVSIGRWEHVGNIGIISLYMSEEVSDNDVYVVYKGQSVDAPAILTDNNGHLGVAFLNADPEFIGTSADYIQKIIITD